MSIKDKAARTASLSTPAAWAADYDLMAFAERLDVRSFSSLSLGIGLGDLRPSSKAVGAAAPTMREVDREVVREMTREAPREMLRAPVAPVSRSQNNVHKAEVLQQQPEQAPAQLPRPATLERRFMAWSVDFLFVTSSMAIALALVTAVAAARASADTGLLELRPVTWLAGFAPHEILIAVYAVYLAYHVTFRFVIGRTFGESLLGVKRAGRRALAGV